MGAIYDPEMVISLGVQVVSGRTLAAVQGGAAPGEVGSRGGLRSARCGTSFADSQALWTGGHNIFVYHHATEARAPLAVQLGV